MNQHIQIQFEARANIIKAMAHPSRLFIVAELSRGERCVCELAEMLAVDMSTASKHLSLLKAASIVVDDKRGSQVFYQLKMLCVLGFIDCVDSVLLARANEANACCQHPR